MSFLGLFSQSAESPDKIAAPRPQRGRSARKRFADAFAQPVTAAEVAKRFGRSTVAILVQLYRYEKRGLVRRAGIRHQALPGHDPILWEWVAK